MLDINKVLFLDVDTLKAFMMFVEGNLLYKPIVEVIKPNLSILTKEAKKHNIGILSVCDRHFGDEKHAFAEVELKVNGGPFDMHAENGTEGAEKIPETLLEKDVMFVPTDLKVNDAELEKMIHSVQQIIIEKQSICAFYDNLNAGGNPVLTRILDMLPQDIDVFVYGVYTEYCIKENAIPFLLRQGSRVWIVKDAIAPYNINPDDGDNALVDLANVGARFTTTEYLCKMLRVVV